MDNENDNIFAAGTSGPQSELDKSGPIPPVAVSGIEGRIDPVAARASSVGTTAGPVAGTSEPAAGGTRRGRPKGSKNRPAETIAGTVTATPETLSKNETPRNIRASFIERMLFSIHMGVAKISECPELKLDADDAKELGEAIAGVLALHKIKITPAQEAYSILFEAAAKVYPPMIVSVVVRKQAEAKGKGKVLKWPHQATPTPDQPTAPSPQERKESILPREFNPASITLPTEP